MNKILKLSSLIIPMAGIATGISFSTTSCGESGIPTCPDNIVINGRMNPNSTVFKTLMDPYNSDWDIKEPFYKTDISDVSKYPTNLIKWDIAWEYTYYFGQEYSANLHFDVFQRQGNQIKYQISMTPLAGGTAIVTKTSHNDEQPDQAEFVDIDVSSTDWTKGTQKKYEIHSWSSSYGVSGDYYKYALSMFTTNLGSQIM